MKIYGDDCLCDECHQVREHRWQDWNVYPECELCLQELAEWLHENTDAGCLIPEYCNYYTHRKRRIIDHATA